MARKEIDITIEGGRDDGKVFRIKELPSTAAEWWAIRLLLAVGRSGVTVTDEALSSGFAGVASLAFRAFLGLNPADARPLLDEMFATIKAIPDPVRPVPRDLVESDIDDVTTRLRLRKEWMELHAGFSIAGVLSELSSRMSAPASTPAPTSPAA